MKDRVTIPQLRQMKARGQKIVMLTCYDYPSALLLDQAGVDVLLVGDSLGDNVLGHPDTLPVTLDDMCHHARAVRRGTRRAMVVVDMPFLSYQVSVEQAMLNAGRLLREAGVDAVKLEGGRRSAPTIARLVEAGIPVMGHIGLTPQSVRALGGYRVQGRTDGAVQTLLEDASALADAGAFAIVLELVASGAAERLTREVTVPTIGIGSGPHCDGQVQVLHDLAGLFPERAFKHARRYAEVGVVLREAAERYATDVRGGGFPGDENSY